ncbi:MAG: VCBS repeat-containing protein [Ignavibacteriales bacterium]|nr:VCBS repeat-containing protein [Ignavibacteriales bacterium]
MKYLLLVVFTFSFLNAQQFTKVSTGPQSNDGGDSRCVNLIDYDNDGDLDLFVTNGPLSKANNFLYKNNGDGTFTKVTDASVVKDPGSYDGSTWADYDNDGNIDVYSATWWGQKNSLHRQYNGKFEKINSGTIANDFTFSETASWGDYDNDGYLDLYLANSSENKANNLYKNNGDGTFTKITNGPHVTENKTSRSVDWFDYDNDGDLDIFVANEGNENNSLYKNMGDGNFISITTGAIVTDGGDSFGSSVGDIDNDGDLDVFVADHANQNDFLYKNNGDGTFTKVTSDPVVISGGYSVGSAFGDVDNDGDLDLFVTNAFSGNSQAKNFLFHNNGNGSFTKIDTGIVVNDPGWSYGVAMGDCDRDGDLDIFTANCFGANQNNSLYRNEGNANKWLTVKVNGTVSNKSGIGTKVKVKGTINGIPVWQYRQVAGQSGYCGQNLESHFGLGNAAMIDSLVVIFPSGQQSVQTNVTPNQVITITEKIPSGYLRGAFIVDSLQGRIPLTVQFTNISVADPAQPITTVQWDFDNDSIVDATSHTAQHTYTLPDTYTVRMIVSNGTVSDTMIAKELIVVLRPKTAPSIQSFLPTVTDTTIPKNGKVNFKVSIIDTSDSPVTLTWTRNSVLQSSQENTYTYASNALFPAPRTDTFKVVAGNEFYSVAKQWLVNVTNVIAGVDRHATLPSYRLDQNYPNPFNPTTTIKFEIAHDGDVTIKLFDSIGRLVQTNVKDTFTKGEHAVEMNAENLPSGIYYYTITTGIFKETKKLMIVK